MKFLVLCFSVLVAICAQSQDLVVFNNGDTLECKITGVNYAGIHAKTDDVRVIYEKERVESYRYRGNWIQVAGPVAAMEAGLAGMSLAGEMTAQQHFEKSLNDAGAWFIAGGVATALLTGAILLLGDSQDLLPVYIAGIVFIPVSTIIAGAKLRSASKWHKLMDLE